MKRALPSGHNDLRVLLGRMETDMYMWSRGYEEVSPRLLDQLLHALQKTITLASDADDRKTLQNIVHQLESVRHAEPVDHQQAQSLAQQTIEDLRALRQRRTSPLHPVAVEEVVGAQVIYFYHDLSTVGQVVRFQPAGEKRAFGFIGNIIIRPCDEQEAMIDVFQGVYALDEGPVSNLYHWPDDLPAQTFLDPGRPTDLVTIEWAEPRHEDEDEDEDEDEGYSGPPTPSLVQQAGDYLKSMLIRKRISAGDGDQRIGMPVYSLIQEQKGCLKSIQVHADGSERWIADGQDGKEISHEGTFFWLEVQGYHQLFPTRVLDQEDIYQHLREALALHEEQGALTELAELEDHDEILQHHQQLDRILKFLNGDMEDEPKERIATVYHQMLWSSVSLDAAQREQAARKTAIEIDRLRQNKEKRGGALMTDEKDETAKYLIYVFDPDSMQEAADGIEVAATMKSLAHSLHEIIRGNREATPEDIRYLMHHVRDLFQFAKTTATSTKLQVILEVLQQAETALNQEEDAEPLLRDAWQLMRKVLSHEEVEKLSASQIELRRSGRDPIIVSGADAWEQANHHLRSWSTTENEDQRVEYVVSYHDGLKDGRWLNLPLFYHMENGERWRIGPELDLGNQIIAALEKSIDLCSQQHASFEAARLEALAYLRHYAVGGSTGVEAVTTAILKFQEEQWSPGIIYRHALHTEHNLREGVLDQRIGGNLPLHMTYTPSDEVAWGYHLYLAGIYDLQVVKRLTTGQEVAIREVVQDIQKHQTRLDFSALPGDEDLVAPKDGETVQITVLQAEAVIASVVFRREEDDRLTVETAGCDLIYLS